MSDAPIYKLVNRKWKELETKGSSVSITDPHLKVGYVGDLTKLNVIQLEELINRQDGILSNKNFISKLKDKGKKLRERREVIKDALEMVRNNTCSPPKIDPDQFSSYEWNGKLDSGKMQNIVASEEDSSADPLRVIASHDQDVPTRKKTSEYTDDPDPSEVILKELENLDLKDSEVTTDTLSQDFGSKTLQYLEQKDKEICKKRQPFKPYKLKNPWLPKENVERNKYLWQESSATGYIGITANNKSQLVPLQQSLDILRKHQLRERERIQRDAISHLSRIKGVNIELTTTSDFNSSRFSSYRDTNAEKHILEDTDDEEEDNIHGNLMLVRADDMD